MPRRCRGFDRRRIEQNRPHLIYWRKRTNREETVSMFMLKKNRDMPAPGAALPGRASAIPTAEQHFVSGHPLKGPYPEDAAKAMFALGCFWGAEKKFWQIPGVWVTAVGY